MSEKYQPKKGDRVRVTFEGEMWSDDLFRANEGGWLLSVDYLLQAEHLEKLAPPEPKWVYGAVVKTPGYRPLVWDGEQWRASSGRPWVLHEDVSKAWKNGTLQVLWNEDLGDE